MKPLSVTRAILLAWAAIPFSVQAFQWNALAQRPQSGSGNYLLSSSLDLGSSDRWRPTDVSRYSYAGALLSREDQFSWENVSSGSPELTQYRAGDYTYDSQGRLTELYYKTQAGDPSSRLNISYNVAGLPDTMVHQTWNVAQQKWFNYERNILAYDGASRVIDSIQQYGNFVAPDVWQNYRRVTTTYNASGFRDTSYITTGTSTGWSFLPSWRHSHFYGAQGHLERLVVDVSQNQLGWRIQTLQRWVFGPSGRLDEVISVEYYGVGADTLSRRGVYTYDALNRLVRVDTEASTSPGGPVGPSKRKIYEYEETDTTEVREYLWTFQGTYEKRYRRRYQYSPSPNSSTATGLRSNVSLSINTATGHSDTLRIGTGVPPGTGSWISGSATVSLIEKVSISLNELLHGNVGELIITLEHAGVIDTIVAQAPGGADFAYTRFSDLADGILDTAGAPYSGSFKPYMPLAAFNGLDPDGEWILTVRDMVSGGSTGVLNAWSLDVTFVTQGATDVPASDELPKGMELDQNYPNPFNPATVVSYTLGQASHVRLAVYDLLGSEVAVLVNETKTPGRYNVTFEAGELASGVYLYRLLVGDHVQTRKMVLIR